MMISNYKSNHTSDKESSCYCSNNTLAFNNNFKLTETQNSIPEKEKYIQGNTSNNYENYTLDDRKKVFELERQVSYLMEDNK